MTTVTEIPVLTIELPDIQDTTWDERGRLRKTLANYYRTLHRTDSPVGVDLLPESDDD